jgi:hypothetical protein
VSIYTWVVGHRSMKLVMCILGINRRPSLHAIPSTSVRKTWMHRALQNKYRLVAASIGKVAYCEPWSGSDLAAGVYAYLASRGAHVHVLAWHSWHVRETSRCLCAMASNALTTCSTRLRPSHLAAALTHTHKNTHTHTHTHTHFFPTSGSAGYHALKRPLSLRTT